MRIALVVDTFPSLSETFISNKAERLAAKGYEVIVFCNKKNNELFSDLFNDKQNIKTVVFKKRNVPLYSVAHPVIFIRAIKALHNIPQNIYRSFRISVINKYRPDIIHFEFSGIGIDYL